MFLESYSTSDYCKQHTLRNKQANIQQEIMTNGPVTGAFTVYADFPAYKSGVYKHVTGDQLGGHAIKVYYSSAVGASQRRQ